MSYDPREKVCPPLRDPAPAPAKQPEPEPQPELEPEPEPEDFGDGMAYHFRPEDFSL